MRTRRPFPRVVLSVRITPAHEFCSDVIIFASLSNYRRSTRTSVRVGRSIFKSGMRMQLAFSNFTFYLLNMIFRILFNR